MQKNNSSLAIAEIPPSHAPMELLELADPYQDKINGYLPSSRCFAASIDGYVVGVCVVVPKTNNVYELMNIAVSSDKQKTGIGACLLKYVIEVFRKAGADRLEVGTGTFGYQLAFYQRHGFRVCVIDKDFFIINYAVPIYENGIQLKDMLRLELDLKHDAIEQST